MTEHETAYQYDQNYPYLKEMERLSGRPSFDAWIAVRAFTEIYFPLSLRPGNRILDVACSTGNLGNALKFGGIETIGVDVNLAALKVGRKLFSKNRTSQAYADQLPFGDKSFDSVVSQDLFEHLPDYETAQKTLCEMGRVNKADKMLHKITVLEDSQWINADESHTLKWTANEWREFFEENGWNVISPTTHRFPVWSRHEIGLGQMHGYFLVQRALSTEPETPYTILSTSF